MAEAVTCHFVRLDLVLMHEASPTKLQQLQEKFGKPVAPDVRRLAYYGRRLKDLWNNSHSNKREKMKALFGASAWDAMPDAEKARHSPSQCAFLN